MNTQRLFVYSGLVALLVTGTASAGRYQQTKDGKTRVWNEDAKPGDLVTWSGARDAEGYATGYGTVTWFRPQKVMLTGSNITRERNYSVFKQVSGTMVHGKLEEAPTEAKAKKKERTRVSEKRRKAPSAQAEPTAKLEKPAPTPTPEKAASPTAAPSPAVTSSPRPASDSLDSLMHAPSSLKLNPPAGTSPIPSRSPTATPDISLQLAPAPSSSPSPQ